MSASDRVEELEGALRAVGEKERAAGAKAYLKSDLEFIGVAAKPLRLVAREFLKRHGDLDHDRLIELVLALWDRPVYELKAAAVALLERRSCTLDLGDLVVVEGLLRRSHTWALVDWLCTKVVAPVVEQNPEGSRGILRRWAADDDFWVRRSSMLSQLPALRRGGGDFELFASFAAAMVEEKEFFVRKAIGWVLRDVSKKRPWLAYGFLGDHVGRVSGLTLREGSKYLPEDQRADLLARFGEASVRRRADRRPRTPSKSRSKLKTARTRLTSHRRFPSRETRRREGSSSTVPSTVETPPVHPLEEEIVVEAEHRPAPDRDLRFEARAR